MTAKQPPMGVADERTANSIAAAVSQMSLWVGGVATVAASRIVAAPQKISRLDHLMTFTAPPSARPGHAPFFTPIIRCRRRRESLIVATYKRSTTPSSPSPLRECIHRHVVEGQTGLCNPLDYHTY